MGAGRVPGSGPVCDCTGGREMTRVDSSHMHQWPERVRGGCGATRDCTGGRQLQMVACAVPLGATKTRPVAGPERRSEIWGSTEDAYNPHLKGQYGATEWHRMGPYVLTCANRAYLAIP